MSNKITFRFDSELEHQIKAINSTVDLFEGLPKQNNSIYNYNKSEHSLINPNRNKDIKLGEKLLNNLKKVQLRNELYLSEEIFDKNFTVEMETGTGKTYVYLRTILELYKKYDFKKFLIVVPSIPIRKGIEKSIEQLGEHFQRLYNIDLKKYCFIYDSGNTTNVRNFIGTTGLRIMITNIQSFNKSVNKIQNEDEYGTVLWDEISHLKTIVIIDEPQKIEGQKNKKSESLKAIEKLEPLFTLRYSATHKNLYNQIYKLDSYDAYKKELVKKIRVKTVNGIISKDFPYIRYTHFTSNAEARIEMFTQKQGDSVRIKTFNVSGNESLEELSGGLSQYKNMFIAEAPHKEKPIRIS
ncbi:MAG: DEAD/DEAH box helicase family protein, partial [Pseudoleptotrichia goodfellowii]|nr:DEAD/DEAH box helicase family protein [Pseudoleptotrichia goodfellowii]